jgi:hypothetical protein
VAEDLDDEIWQAMVDVMVREADHIRDQTAKLPKR